MREVKFRLRLKNKHDGEIIYVCAPLINEECGFMNYPVNFKEWELLSCDQYTGLSDKYRVEIYEGDIIEISYDTNFSNKPYYRGFVKYGIEDGYPAFDLDPWIDCQMNALAC